MNRDKINKVYLSNIVNAIRKGRSYDMNKEEWGDYLKWAKKEKGRLREKKAVRA